MEKNIFIIGAGIAGSSLAHFLAKSGWTVTLLEEQHDIAQGGSGNPVAAIYPKFMVSDEAYNNFMLKSFMFTTAWISQLGLDKNDYKFDGAIEILEEEYAHRLAFNLSKKIPNTEKLFSTLNQSILKKYSIDKESSGLFFHKGGWVNPVALCRYLINNKSIKVLTGHKIVSIKKLNNQWALKTQDKKKFNTHYVAICNAEHVQKFDLTEHLFADAFRGQINWVNQTSLKMPSIVSCDEGYLAPLIRGKHIFGATYAMNDFEKNLKLSDTRKNITSIKEIHQAFYEHCLAEKTIDGRVAWRASAKDRKPYVGRVFDNELFTKMRVRELAQGENLPWLKGLYVASAFGSRGLTYAPYSAYVLSNLINENLTNEDKETLNYTNPERYRLKKMSLKKVASRIFQV